MNSWLRLLLGLAVVMEGVVAFTPSFPNNGRPSSIGLGLPEEAEQSAPGISSHELRQMSEAQRQRQEPPPVRSRFVTGDDLQSLRREVLTLSEERHELLQDNTNPHRLAELEQAIAQAQHLDAEYVYHVSKKRAARAFKAGMHDASHEFRREAARARAELPQFNLEGLWVGKYGDQGFEMINITYHEDTLVAYKVTGDQNVPKGEVSFTVDLSPNPRTLEGETPLLQPIELNHDAAEQWGSKFLPRYSGRGQVAHSGFHNAQWMDGQLIMVNQYFSFAWLPIGHQVFFGRPSAELTLKLLRESRCKEFSDESSRAFITRCWEETEYIEDDMEVSDGLFKSHEQSDYYDMEGCFE